MNPRLLTCALLAAALLTACSSPSASQPADTPTTAPADESAAEGAASVAARNIAFDPAELRILRGTTVTWTNGDAGVRHTATSGTPGQRGVPGVQDAADAETDGRFDGDMPEAGDTFEFTFDEAGTYEYFCVVHPSMTATVVVE